MTFYIINNNCDDLVKSRKTSFFVIPAKAGIQFIQLVTKALDSGFHRSDDFLRVHQLWMSAKKSEKNILAGDLTGKQVKKWVETKKRGGENL